MRRGLIVAIFVLCLVSVSARTIDIDLYFNQSQEEFGKNITLISVDTKEDKAIICVNQEKFIITDTKNIDGLSIDLRTVKKDYISLDLESSCTNCKCEDKCDNSICFDKCQSDDDCLKLHGYAVKCSGTPKECVYEEIVNVEENTTEETVKGLCLIDKDCDDDDKCTVDSCTNEECKNVKIQNCNGVAATEEQSSPSNFAYYLIFLVVILGLLVVLFRFTR